MRFDTAYSLLQLNASKRVIWKAILAPNLLRAGTESRFVMATLYRRYTDSVLNPSELVGTCQTSDYQLANLVRSEGENASRGERRGWDTAVERDEG